ncbi:multisubunit sodium/proton antiporter MrpA subunit /multisubunit sodium/proton antiporter MrpB subunit [Nonomuraea fuscirosea]|uniref:Multisubunit sodium/proton antiporter MrpA subunit /multisubunit sodium/proton antiporter MrpB subunit n=1 Tax=Nonomuraea fuscirosea TaxID=1291556 RepID=A0A2T0M7C3_9ACTN|nr:Na+/H+ antiporter subunit A [Nonomuraea fuscirosea]PRX53315.1 multisubunit sodium/proton antiporter MrpA subunit /multisubunit sodium/proton antiporter MrpB subunit [Nonomuraea fuscirosea]
MGPLQPVESLLILHAVAAACAPWLVVRLGRASFALLALPPAAGFAYAGWTGWRGLPARESTPWAPVAGLELSFRVDPLALLMTALVTGVGVLVLCYSARYFPEGDEGLGRYGGVMVAFAGSMLGLVTADNLLLLYVFWELTTVFSYLLIGSDPQSRPSRQAAMKALTVTTLGGLAMLAGFVLLGQAAGTYRISEIVASPPGLAPAAVVLVLVGALSKSAIFPFSTWLPAAMAAPTPVSAYLHAAAMVKAGVYLLARLGPAYGDLTLWRAVAVPLGVVTMLLGGWRALRENDLKRLLAYGTVSQLGFLVLLFGAGTRGAALAGVGMLLAHALFKAALFLVVGIVDHAAGTRDLRELSGAGRAMPWVCAAAVLAGASMAGLPPLAGFAGKEAALESLMGSPALVGVVAGSALTAAYTLRFLWGAFAAKPGVPPRPMHPTPAAMSGPAALLAVLGLVLAPLTSWYAGAMSGYTDTFREAGHHSHLALWSGFTPALLLSALALAAGVLLFLTRAPVARAGAALHVADSGQLFWLAVRRLDRFAIQLTGFIQRGSVPDYLMLTLLAAVGVGLFSVVYGGAPHVDVPIVAWQRPEQPIVVALLAAAAVLALFSRAYVLLALVVGLTGYGTALLFLAHGSPDLALTQFLAETLSLVVFALVLRRLPIQPVRGRVPVAVRLALGLAVGVVASGGGMVAMAARGTEPVGALMEEAARESGARNIVSAIILDIRAWDTLGESAVVIVLTLGVTSMVFLRRRTFAIERSLAGHRTEERPHWLAATLPRGQRALALEVVARLTFHTVLTLSVFLLFIGHSGVGGGFAGGIVAGLAITVRYLAGGRNELAVAVPAHAGVLMGAGLTLSAGTALIGLLFGRAALEMLATDVSVPLLGHVHLSTGLLFDLGVYVSIVGMVQDVLRGLGAELDRQIDAEETP